MTYRPQRAASSPTAPEGSQPDDDQPDYSKKKWVVILGVICLAVGTLIAAWQVGKEFIPRPTTIAERQPSSDEAIPAPSRNPPLLVEAVADLRSTLGGGDFAVAKEITLAPSDQQALSGRGKSRGAYGQWLKNMRAAAISPATTTITIVGNWDEEVSISDINLHPECDSKYRGTYFATHTAGGGDTGRIGFSLDDPDPVAREVAFNAGVGTITNVNYFEANTITLQQYESTTLSLWMFSSTLECRFDMEIEIATSRGRFLQHIDEPSSSPFRITPAPKNTADFAKTYVEEMSTSGRTHWREKR